MALISEPRHWSTAVTAAACSLTLWLMQDNSRQLIFQEDYLPWVLHFRSTARIVTVRIGYSGVKLFFCVLKVSAKLWWVFTRKIWQDHWYLYVLNDTLQGCVSWNEPTCWKSWPKCLIWISVSHTKLGKEIRVSGNQRSYMISRRSCKQWHGES